MLVIVSSIVPTIYEFRWWNKLGIIVYEYLVLE